jgi:hypothetical protein
MSLLRNLNSNLAFWLGLNYLQITKAAEKRAALVLSFLALRRTKMMKLAV